MPNFMTCTYYTLIFASSPKYTAPFPSFLTSHAHTIPMSLFDHFGLARPSLTFQQHTMTQKISSVPATIPILTMLCLVQYLLLLRVSISTKTSKSGKICSLSHWLNLEVTKPPRERVASFWLSWADLVAQWRWRWWFWFVPLPWSASTVSI